MNNAVITIRLPDDLRIVIEALSIAKRLTLSDIVRQLLETHPEVVFVAERLYSIATETPAGKD